MLARSIHTETMKHRSLETLRRHAAKACNFRGHSMQWSNPFGSASGPHSMFGTCRHCRMEVLIREAPAPNGIDIGGEAVALQCRRINENAAPELLAQLEYVRGAIGDIPPAPDEVSLMEAKSPALRNYLTALRGIILTNSQAASAAIAKATGHLA